jgi:hypothetical protein
MAGGLEGLGKYIRALGSPLSESIDKLTDKDFIQETFFEVDEKATSIAKSFGQSREHILALKQNMTDAYTDVAKMGGSFDDIANIQEKIGTTLKRNVILSSDSYKELYAMMSVTKEDIGIISEKFKDIGHSVYTMGSEMQKVIDTSRNLGLNVEAVTENVLTNMDSINKYTFQGGVEGLAKMAAQATSLRVDMRQTLGFAEKVYNPEGAIETAAALQRLGVTQSQLLDPLRLMNLAQNDPTELQNQIVEMTKSFVTLGKSGNFEIMPGAKRRFQEIAKSMQIPYGELTKMALGSAELEDKMKKIKFPDAEHMASKETRQMIANLAEKGKDGEYRITFSDKEGKKQEKLVSELSEKDVEALKLPPKKMEELAESQLSVQNTILAKLEAMKGTVAYAAAGATTTEQIMQAEVKMYDKITNTFIKTFDVTTIRDKMDSGIQSMFDSILKGDIVNGFQNAGQDMIDFFGNITNTFSDEATKNWKDFINDENKVIKVFNKLGDQIKNLGDEGIVKLSEKINQLVNQGAVVVNRNTNPGNANPVTNVTVSDFIFSPSPMQEVTFPDIPEMGTITALPEDKIEIRGGTETSRKNEREYSALQNVIRESQTMQRDVLTQQQSNMYSFFDKFGNRPNLEFQKEKQIETKNDSVTSNINLTLNVNVTGNGVSKSQVEDSLRDVGLINMIRTELQKLNAPNGTKSPTEIRNTNNKGKFGK